MTAPGIAQLAPRTTAGAAVTPLPGGWRLSLPPGPAGVYRWAQLDDYLQHPRSAFPWRPPATLELEARASSSGLPGTWGFGWWNDPFSLSLGVGGTQRRLPALPNTAWFFHASAPNYLSLYDNLPAQGFLAATFRSQRWPPSLVLPALAFAPLLGWPAAARRIRRIARRWVHQSAVRLDLDTTQWHRYAVVWEREQVVFIVDGNQVYETEVSPDAPLGLVIWIDNQYAAFTPQGEVKSGTLATPAESWLEVRM